MAMDWKDEDLVFACHGRNYSQAIEMLALGADPNARPPEEWWEDDPNKWEDFYTPLHCACKHGELSFVKLLIETYNCSFSYRDGLGRTPLDIACMYGHLSIVQYIAKTKGAMNLFDDTYQSPSFCSLAPVQYACQYGHADIVEYLVGELGCRFDLVDRKKQSLLHYACEKGYTRIAHYLCKQGINLEARDINQSTPLHLASKVGHLDIVKYLLEHGCNPDVANNKQWTPLHYAGQYGHIDVVKCLFAHGCDPEPADRDQYTPLHVAISQWKCTVELSLEVVKFLINVAHVSKTKTAKGEDALLLASREGRLKCMQLLIAGGHYGVNVKDKDGNAPLHFACRKSRAFNWKQIIKWLLEEAGCDPNVRNKAGETPLQLTTDNVMILELIRHGATTPDVYAMYGRALGLHHPLQPSVQLFMVGDYSTGKSTLVTSFKKISSFLTRAINRRRRVSGVRENTTGIVPYEFQKRRYGHLSLYDCAGRKEFHGCHVAVLENAIHYIPPIFVVVVNLTESSEEIRQNLLYWLSTLNSQCTSVSRAHVIIVGSHADVLIARGEDANRKLESIVAPLPQFAKFESPAYIAMNCQYPESTGMTQLRRFVLRSSVSTNDSEMHFNTHCMYTYILNQFRGSCAVSLRQIQLNIKNERGSSTEHDAVYFLPTSISALHRVCEELNDQGHLLYLSNPESNLDSWIVVNKPALLSEVIGTIFAPADFKQHRYQHLASGKGLVSLSAISNLFSHYDPEMLVGFLSTLEHCLEVSRQQVNEIFPQYSYGEIEDSVVPQSSGSGERYLLFPGLVTIEVPTDAWKPSPEYSKHCGWILQCSDPNQLFPAHFIQALILRLIKALALTPESNNTGEDAGKPQQECTLWRKGFHWKSAIGVEVLVEQLPHAKDITLVMRCREDCVLKCVQVRSRVIQNALKTAREICGNISTVESVITPSQTTQHPLKPLTQLDLVRLKDIAMCCVHGKSMVLSTNKTGAVPLQDVALFEPYAGLGESLLRPLLDEQSRSRYHTPSDDFVSKFAEAFSDKEKLVQIFTTVTFPHPEQHTTMPTSKVDAVSAMLSWRDQNNGTYQSLREILDTYSIFSGRNPLLLTL